MKSKPSKLRVYALPDDLRFAASWCDSYEDPDLDVAHRIERLAGFFHTAILKAEEDKLIHRLMEQCPTATKAQARKHARRAMKAADVDS